jgi:hypothetical protein
MYNGSSKIKKRLFFILYNVAVVIVFIGLMELVFQYLLQHPANIPNFLLEPYRKYYSLVVRSTIQMEPACARYDEKLFYTLKPGSCTFSNIEFSNDFNINSLGTRDIESALHYPEIIFLGDSFTMGWGVDQDSSYVGRIKHKTNKKILNAGISSYGTVRELKLLERIQRDSLKTLVIQYHSNDAGENKIFYENDNNLKISSHEEYDRYAREVRARPNYFFGRHTAFIGKFVLKGIIESRHQGKKSELENNGVKYFLNALKHSPVPLQGINIVVFEASNYNQSDSFLDQLRHEMEINTYPDYIKRIKIINLGDILSDEDHYILDEHLNLAGHKKIADKLSQIL